MDFLERYRFDFKNDLLGYGGFGEVYKAYDTLLNREVALKFYKGRGSSKYDLISEIKKVIRLHHPNLLEFYDATILSQQNAFGQYEDLQVGVMEYANEGDLLDFIASNPTKEEIRIVTLGILSGLQFMHENGFIHRDLKPQNILFVKKGKRIIPKIADFGISKNALSDNTNDSTKLIGTVEYMAPEQFNPKFAINNKPHYNLDLWALGVMLFELLNGQPPFGKRSQTTHSEQIMHNICYEQAPNKFEKIDEPFKTVLNRCLVKDAKKRAKSANELKDIIINFKESPKKVKKDDKPSHQPKKTSTKRLVSKEIINGANKSKNIKRVFLVLLLISLGIASFFFFKKERKDLIYNKKSFRTYIDLADREEGLNTLLFLDTALFYLDTSYNAYEFGDSMQEPRVLKEVLEEIKRKKLKATDFLKEEEIELRALDILTIESEFDGWDEINKVWFEEVFKLNQN